MINNCITVLNGKMGTVGKNVHTQKNMGYSLLINYSDKGQNTSRRKTNKNIYPFNELTALSIEDR